MADPCAPRGPGRLVGVIFCLLMTLILAREIGALLGARVELPGMSENPAWTSPTAIREGKVGTRSPGSSRASLVAPGTPGCRPRHPRPRNNRRTE